MQWGGGIATSLAALDLMVSAHMDDFKATGPQASLNLFRGMLSTSFGGGVQMEQESSFIHTGIRHTKVQKTFDPKFHYVLDQNEYASAINPVMLPELMNHNDEDVLLGVLQNCLVSFVWCDGMDSPNTDGDSGVCLGFAEAYACTSRHRPSET